MADQDARDELRDPLSQDGADERSPRHAAPQDAGSRRRRIARRVAVALVVVVAAVGVAAWAWVSSLENSMGVAEEDRAALDAELADGSAAAT